MKFALVNPRWSFEGSTYFGCPDPHFPLELLSAREFLRYAACIAPTVVPYLAGRADYSEYLGIPHVPGAGELALFCAGIMGAGPGVTLDR